MGDGDKPVSVEDVAQEVIRLRKDLTRLKKRCGKCRHRRKIGFEPADVQGGPLDVAAHKLDEEDEP